MSKEEAPVQEAAGMSAEALGEAAQRTEALAAGLYDLKEVVGGKLGFGEPASRLGLRADALRADRFRIMVVGGFNRGKSTLLNAMLGTDILPQKVVPSTAIITLLEHAERPAVRVRFADGAPEETLELEEFRARYVLGEEDMNDGRIDSDRFTRVDHAVVAYPIELCRHRVELVDSPGLQDDPVRTARTIRFLRRADAVVMVLDATTLLTEDEMHFLDTVLVPEGLRNIFFVINKWNLVREAALRPGDAERDYADLEERIRTRLAPFCRIGASNLSAERIFRVDALGALKARMAGPSAAARLEESNVPAFERSLQRFLVEERRRVKADVIIRTVSSVDAEVKRFIDTQQAMAGKSIEEIAGEIRLLQPKLDRLKGIRQHILGYLDTQSVNLQDRLAISLQQHIAKLEAKLPEEVDNFDLSPILGGSIVGKSLIDWARSDENKFAAKLRRCVEPQLKRLLDKHFTVWREAVVKNEIQAVTIDVDKHLHDEAAEYQRVMREIESQLGVRGGSFSADDRVMDWKQTKEGSGGDFELSGMGALGDIGWLVGSIAIEVAADVMAHVALAWVPVVGFVITAVRLVWRETNLRQQLRDNIVKAAIDGLRQHSQSRVAAIRLQIKEGFARFKEKIAGNIGEEIVLVEASLLSIIDRRRNLEHSKDQEEARLAGIRREIDGILLKIRQAAS